MSYASRGGVSYPRLRAQTPTNRKASGAPSATKSKSMRRVPAKRIETQQPTSPRNLTPEAAMADHEQRHPSPPTTHEDAMQQLVELQRDDRAFVEKLFVAREEHHERRYLMAEEAHLRQMILNGQFSELTELEDVIAHHEHMTLLEDELADETSRYRQEVVHSIGDELAAAEEAIQRAQTLRFELEAHDQERERLADGVRKAMDQEKTDLYVLLSELELRYKDTVRERKDVIIEQNYPAGSLQELQRRSATESSPALLPSSRRTITNKTPPGRQASAMIMDVADVISRSNEALASVADILSGTRDSRPAMNQPVVGSITEDIVTSGH